MNEGASGGRSYDILIIDAYSSDSVPVHLMTLEAIDIYRSRLKADGVLVFHISNRFFALAPVLARAAKRLGLTALHQFHPHSGVPLGEGGVPSRVVIMSADPERLTEFATQPRWDTLISDDKAAWTDDFANVLGALR
ncbi:hypothetical protein [Halovulum sp. GXIMD14793]